VVAGRGNQADDAGDHDAEKSVSAVAGTAHTHGFRFIGERLRRLGRAIGQAALGLALGKLFGPRA